MKKNHKELNDIFFEMRNTERFKKNLPLISPLNESTIPPKAVGEFLKAINVIQKKYGMQLVPDAGDIYVRAGSDDKNFKDIVQDEEGHFDFSNMYKAMMDKASEDEQGDEVDLEKDSAEADKFQSKAEKNSADAIPANAPPPPPPPMSPKPEKNVYKNEGLDIYEKDIAKFLK
jgi:hypothetical protein